MIWNLIYKQIITFSMNLENKFLLICVLLAWEPSVAKVLIITPAVYPHMVDFYRETTFCYNC